MEKDSNGVILEVGQLVAFNHSGAVRLGRIEKIGGTDFNRFARPSGKVAGGIKISRLIPAAIKTKTDLTDGISKVLNANGIMVIDKKDIMIHFL